MPARTKPLARTAGLVTRTPLTSASTPGSHSTLRRSAPLAPVSKKRARENRERRAMVTRLYPERPRCACGCGRLADDLHEILSRARGGSITDPANCVPLARYCHDKATNEDPLFYDLSLVVHSWAAERAESELAAKNFSGGDAA
jgi:5-methylcytosine-specific restriction endonuclease McrA